MKQTLWLRWLLVGAVLLPSARAGEIETAMFPLFWEDCGASQGIKLADLNGDGMLDLITASDSGDVCTRLGNGDGTFGPNLIKEVASPTCLASPVVADFDNDDRLDVLVLEMSWENPPGNDAWLVPGNGDGTLGPPMSVDSGAFGVWGAAVGDFDENDAPDLLFANEEDGVILRLGAGDGQFFPVQELTPNQPSYCVVVDDFDGDGHDDFATTTDNDQVHVFLGNGEGAFLSSGLFEVQVDQDNRFASGDVDGDGDSDLVVPSRGDDVVSVLTANGDGTFQPAQEYAVPPEPYNLAIGDIDGDGNPDIAVSHIDSFGAVPKVNVLWGTGAGGFAPAQGIGPPAWIGFDVVIVDLDRDGFEDLVAEWWWLGSTFLRNRGDGTFLGYVASPLDDASTRVIADDVDGDGVPDLLVAPPATDPGPIGIMLGNGDGTFALADEVGSTEVRRAYLAAELGQGPFKDLASVDDVSNTVRVYPGIGGGTFGPASSSSVGDMPQSLAAGDLDGDDDLDLVVGNLGSDDVSVLLQEAGGFAPEQRFPSVEGPVSVALGFVDADAILDLVVLGSSALSSHFALHLGAGNGTFGSPTIHLTGVQNPVSITLMDITGDGPTDVVVATQPFWYQGVTQVFPGVGDGSFLPAIATDLSARTYADVDGDGRTDILGEEELALGNGDGTFGPPFGIGVLPEIGTAGDFDLDGRTDLASLAHFGIPSQIFVYPNDCLNLGLQLESSAEAVEWRAVCGAQSYNVYRREVTGALGDLDEDGLPDGGYGTCVNDLDDDTTDTRFADPEAPLSGDGFAYLVGRVDLDGEGGLGATSAGLPRAVDVPCP